MAAQKISTRPLNINPTNYNNPVSTDKNRNVALNQPESEAATAKPFSSQTASPQTDSVENYKDYRAYVTAHSINKISTIEQVAHFQDQIMPGSNKGNQAGINYYRTSVFGFIFSAAPAATYMSLAPSMATMTNGEALLYTTVFGGFGAAVFPIIALSLAIFSAASSAKSKEEIPSK